MTTNNSDRRSPGFWMNLFNSFRIAWRLMWDSRVPVSAKAIPVLAVLYVLSPIDILPDFVVGLGQLDDLAILLLGTQLFISMSPQDIVKRLRAELEGRAPEGEWNVTGSKPNAGDKDRSSASNEVIDG
jgi:uncharacterized membrane protein YkvA (DUF1232 family)